MKKKLFAAVLALTMALTLTVPTLAAGGTAYVSNQAVEVDGKKIEFQMYALKDANGNGTNYVKLRDVAHVLNGTAAQFSVGYDSASQAISVTSGQPYTDLGSEMVTPFSSDRSYSPAANPVLVNGKAASLEAISLTDDNGGGYTYFKLRDLGAALGFTVDWTAQRGVYIETGTASQPETPVTPAGTKDIAVTTKETQYGTGYYVGDNGFGTGKLNNGKAITEDNVLELLAEAEKIWPTGTRWTNSGTYDNHWYQSSGSVVDGVLLGKHGTSTNYACGGFAAMISDYLFGKDGNPARLVTDHSKIRPGDIIVMMKPDGRVSHVVVATSSPVEKEGIYQGRVYYADGNGSKQVGWPTQWQMPIDNYSWAALGGGELIVYTRYPE